MSERKGVVIKSSAPKKIAKIQFGTLPTEEIHKVGEFEVSSRMLFELPSRQPAAFGCMDSRLGVSDKVSSCQTCMKKLTDCAGHFGFIQLELPVFHAGFFKHTLTILQCICKRCARVLLPVEERVSFLRKLRSKSVDALIRAALFKRIVELCKRVSRCPYCDYGNGVVKKIGSGTFKIVHEKHRAKQAGDQADAFAREMQEILRANPELSSYVGKDVELLCPLRSYHLLTKIVEEDVTLLWMNSDFGLPRNLIMWAVPVPPVPIRPSVPQESGGGSTEDDITIKLQEIVEMNNALKLALHKGATMKMVAEDWEFLQIQVALFINGETPGIPRQLVGPKTVRGLCQRLKGKQGRFRGNLSGKRVDFSGRTVISPDPNLRIEQVGVPVLVAKVMTYPERVNQYNMKKMKELVLNGADVHPGANIVRTGNLVISLQFADRRRIANNLKIGDIVERHMLDDDVVLFNRQPSLHKMSIMAHRVRVFPWRTFRFNECCCTPYNADFDGDEMNMHLPQTEEARAEAAELMAVTYNLITPRNGEPLIAATQDFLTGAFHMTRKDSFFTREEFCRLIAYLSDASEHVDLPPPTIWKPRRLWTGKQIISLLVRPNKSMTSFVNVESEEKFYTGNKHFCEMDGFSCFRNGELISGSLGKKTLGGESKSGLFYVLIRDYGAQDATRCMSRLAKLCARFLGDRGFSIGIDDVTPSAKMLAIKEKIMNDGTRASDDQIDAYKSGRIRLKPGCDALQSLESEINGILGRIRDSCGKEALNALNPRNAALAMANCGSKGSALNISQMVASLGQQNVGGSRIQNGFVNRTLPHFQIASLSPSAKGFVMNSFFTGLTATEFFFHTMGGREGLVDTAVKTAETGYMARRLMKALEDLSMQYDNTVRNSEQTIVQFSYGDDGLNPSLMEKGDRPVDYSRLLTNVRSADRNLDDTNLSADDLRNLINEELSKPHFQALLPQGQQFLTETKAFFLNLADDIAKLEKLKSELFRSPALTGVTASNVPAKSSTGRGKKATSTPVTAVASTASGAESTPRESVSKLRQRLLALPLAEKNTWQQRAMAGESPEALEMFSILRDNLLRITASQMNTILTLAYNKYCLSRVVPGEAVGAIGAQSLSEPGTQMTLKTFHFAGVASMNVTLGVPRLKEIINASKQISTPIIEARLVQSDSTTSARIVKAQIEKTTLGEVAIYVKEIHSRNQSYLSIKLDLELIQKLHLNIDANTVRLSILQGFTGSAKHPVLRMLKEKHIHIVGSRCNRLHVFPPDAKETPKGPPASQRIYFTIQALRNALPAVIVQGIPTVNRSVINEEADKDGRKRYYLLVEGYGLSEVMTCAGIDGLNSKTNNISEMQAVLGIEAARAMISSEIKYIMDSYGITVDRRHLMLLSDVMTFKGDVLGITRFGVAKMRESVLMLASFEKTTDHLFDAAVHSRQDSIVGVSECIIMGIPIPLGTGLFKLLQSPAKSSVSLVKRQRMLETI